MGNALQTHEGSLTFWTELKESPSKSKWVHALPVGSWKHPLYGTVDHSYRDIQKFADNINEGIRGIDPYVNYDHREKGGEAAGWIKQAEARDNGLWVFVEWTEEAARKLDNKEYRYWSTEFTPKWENPHTEEIHENVVVGGALTNVPFLKNLVPVNLSELHTEKDEVMDREKLIGLLELSEDATDEQIEQAIKDKTKGGDGVSLDLSKLKVEQDGKTVKVTHPDVEEGEFTFEVEPVKEKKEEDDEELAQLAESNPAVAKLMEQQEESQKAIQRLETANRLSEVEVKLDELGGSDKGLPPVVKDKLKSVLARLPVKLNEDINDALVELFKVGFVDLNEGGQPSPNTRTKVTGDPVKDFMDKVDEAREKDEELSYSAAVDKIALSEPDLWEQYNEALNDPSFELTE